jgi:hypothetical protein
VTAQGDTLEKLYEAFVAKDGEAMADCYAPDATFDDPVFGLQGGDVGDMWRMLTERGKDTLKIEYRIVDDAHAEWAADYVFEGHPVHNEIRSAFEFDADGRITKQTDSFDFPKWAGQALGWKGKLLGRTGFLHKAVRKTSAGTLRSWQRHRAGG